MAKNSIYENIQTKNYAGLYYKEGKSSPHFMDFAITENNFETCTFYIQHSVGLKAIHT
jgi:hypothetical protein